MIQAIGQYFTTLTSRFGDGWNRFWFTPADPLVLGALRIMTGLVALSWCASYGPDLARLFANDGLLTVNTLNQWVGQTVRPSYLYSFDEPTDLRIIHAVGMVILGLMTVGLFSRVTSILSLVVTLSYIHRAPMLTSQVEPILAMVLFYLCIGPSGACLSIDRVWRRRRAASLPPIEREEYLRIRPSYSANIAIRLIQIHLTAVYLSMGVAKLAGQVWWDGTAVWWMLARPESRLVDWTDTLREWPRLINAWSHAIVLFELGFGFLVWNRLLRPLVLAVAVVMWPLVILATGQFIFGVIMLVATFAFISPEGLRIFARNLAGRSPEIDVSSLAKEAAAG